MLAHLLLKNPEMSRYRWACRHGGLVWGTSTTKGWGASTPANQGDVRPGGLPHDEGADHHALLGLERLPQECPTLGQDGLPRQGRRVLRTVREERILESARSAMPMRSSPNGAKITITEKTSEHGILSKMHQNAQTMSVEPFLGRNFEFFLSSKFLPK